MNTSNLTQLLNTSPSAPSTNRSNAGAATAGDGFGRVMARAVADQAPPKPAPGQPHRDAATTSREPNNAKPAPEQRSDATKKAATGKAEPPKDVARGKPEATKDTGADDSTESQTDAVAAEAPVTDSVAAGSATPDSNATPTLAAGAADTAAMAKAASAADLLLPTAPAANPTSAAVAAAGAAPASAATTTTAEKSPIAVAAQAKAIDAANATATQAETAASATEENAAPTAVIAGDARLRLRSDARGAVDGATTAQAETVAAETEEDAAVLAAPASNARLQPKSDAKGAVIAAANAARAQGLNGATVAATKSEHGAGEPAPHVAAEQHFEHLLGAKALSAPRADSAAGTVPFANLLNSSAPTTAHSSVTTPVGTPGFAQDFGQRVVLLAAGQIKSVELMLTPADLGPVRVTVEMRGQEASLVFAAAASATRAAIEEAMPRLREMFAQQGLNLLNASVGAEVGQHSQNAYGRPNARRDGARGLESPAGIEAAASAASSRRPVRLIDVIA